MKKFMTFIITTIKNRNELWQIYKYNNYYKNFNHMEVHNKLRDILYHKKAIFS